MDHARLSCSDTRWPHCPGSIRECQKYPRTSSKAALQGTGTHELLKVLLENPGILAIDYVGQCIGLGHEDKSEGWIIGSEQANRVQIAIDYINSRIRHMGGRDTIVESEILTNPGKKYGRNDWWGTCDVSLYFDGNLEVIDYKDGFTYVNENTSQLVSYAVGQVLKYPKTRRIIKTIIQPKNKTCIRHVMHTVEQNNVLGQQLADAAYLTDDTNAPLIPGEHCNKWCSHIGNCTSRNEIATEFIKSPINPVDMTSSQLSDANDAIPLARNLIEAIEKETEDRINSGHTVPGYAMVSGRKSGPKWSDAKVALRRLASFKVKIADRTSNKAITPTKALQIESLTEPQIASLEKLIIRGERTVKLKKVARATAKDLFGDVTKEVARATAKDLFGDVVK